MSDSNAEVNVRWGFLPWTISLILLGTAFVWSLQRIESSWPWQGLYPMIDPDSVLYIRWLEQSLLQGKQLAQDLYMTFPVPHDIRISPLYREILYRFSLFLHLIPGMGPHVETLLGLLPPIGALSVQMLLLGSLIWRKAPRALLYLVAFSALPGFSHFTTFDYYQLDHHWLEVSCIGFWLVLGDWYQTTPRDGFVIAGGIVIAVFIGVWSGSPLFAAVICLLVLLKWIIDASCVVRLAEFMSGTMLIGAGITAVFLLTHPIPAASTPFSGLGWTQVGLFCLAGFGGRALAGFRQWWPAGGITRGILAALFIGFGLLVAYLLFPASLAKAADFFLKTNPVIQSISELRAAFEVNSLARVHGPLSSVLRYWSILPLFLGLPILWLSRGKEGKPGRLIVEFSLLVFCFALYQLRFTRWLAPGSALVIGIVFYELWSILRKALGKDARLACSLVFFPFLFIHIGICQGVAAYKRDLPRPVVQALSWLREKAPETAGYGDNRPPEYGVVNFWDLGNAIAYFARRPVVVSNTQMGYKRMAKVLFAQDEDATYRYCRENRLRYLFLTPIPGDEAYLRFISGMAETGDDDVEFDLSKPTRLGDAEKTWKSLYFWVFSSLGLKPFGSEGVPARHIRIVFIANDAENPRDASVKIAEIVSGARIFGRADPGTTASLTLKIWFGPIMRIYRREAVVDASGLFSVTVPYATDGVSGNVRTGRYAVSLSRKGERLERAVTVPEQAVRDGGNISIDE